MLNNNPLLNNIPPVFKDFSSNLTDEKNLGYFWISRGENLKISWNRTGASPGTFFTVSGTARMVPAEDPTGHFGTKRRVVVWLYIQSVPISCKVIWEVKTLMLFRCRLKNGRCLYESDISSFRVKQTFRVLWTSKRSHTKLAFTAYYHLAKPTVKKNIRIQWSFIEGSIFDSKIVPAKHCV